MLVELRGADQFQALARQLRAAGAKGLGREMAAGLRKATAPITRAVDAEAGQVMPNRGGYRRALTGSLRHRTEVRTTAVRASVKVRTYADGTGSRRDVPALNKGQLRHPVYGRSRKLRRGPKAGSIRANPWAVTRIRAGFWDRPTARAMPAAQAEMAKVLDDVAARLARG